MKPYPKYRDSGVEWIGRIPEGWKVQRLKYIADLKSGNMITADLIKESDEYPVYGGNGLRGYCSSYSHNGSFVLIGRQGALCGNICYATGKFWASEHAVVATLLGHSSSWLGELLRTMDLNQYSQSAAQPGLAVDYIKNLFIPIPSRHEQNAIAAYLDRKTAKIDDLIAKKRRLIELLTEERIAVINQAVTKGLDPSVKMKDSGVGWSEKVPEGWEIKRLKYVADFKSGNSISADLIEENGEYAVYGGNGLRGYTSSYSHDGAFVLIGRQGALCGNICYATGKFWASEHAVVATLLRGHSLIWFGELLKSMNLNQYSQSAAQPGLAVDYIKNLYIPIPSNHEQIAIANYLDYKTTQINQTISKSEKQIQLLQEYRTALISEVVTGKIDVREEVSA